MNEFAPVADLMPEGAVGITYIRAVVFFDPVSGKERYKVDWSEDGNILATHGLFYRAAANYEAECLEVEAEED